jgi:hypothetical protein
MDAEYPEHLLAREPAPPYDGEGPFAVWHFSEDPGLGRFLPREPAADPGHGHWYGRSTRATRRCSPRTAFMSWRAAGCGDLVGRHAEAGIELRMTPSIWLFWQRVANSTVGFSGSRLRNSAPHPDRPE